MITAKTPGAYIIDRGGKNKGYPKFTKEQVEELRAQGLSWADIATILGIPKNTLHHRWYRWKKQEANKPPPGQVSG